MPSCPSPAHFSSPVRSVSLLAPEHWQVFLAAWRDGVQIWSDDGRLLYANPAIYRLFGLPENAPIHGCADLLSCCVDTDGNPLVRGKFAICMLAEMSVADKETLLRVRNATGNDRWLRIQAYRQGEGGAGGENGYIISTNIDVTHFVEQERVLQLQAHYDALTHLPNRVLLADRLRLALSTALRRGELLAVCMMDLEGFKPINDT